MSSQGPAAYACAVVVYVVEPWHREALGATLSALAEQNPPADGAFETVVVGAFHPDLDAVVAEARRIMDLRFVCLPAGDLTVAKALDAALPALSAPLCVLVEPGVALAENAVAAHLAAHAAHQGPAVVCGRILREVEPAVGGPAEFEPDAFDPAERLFARLDAGADELGTPAPWMALRLGHASAPVELLGAVGGADRTLITTEGAGLELGYRLHQAGAAFVLGRQAVGVRTAEPRRSVHEPRRADADRMRIAEKYDTPITRLLPLFPYLDFATMNDLIGELSLPDCASYRELRARRDARAAA